MRTFAEMGIWSAVVVASLAVHAAAFGGLRQGTLADGGGRRQRPPAMVEMTVSPPKAPPPEAPRPAVEPKARVAMARPAATTPKAAPTPIAAPPPASESPADFTGQTLTNEGPGAGWTSATGNGLSMNGPVGRPGARVTHRVVEGEQGGAGHGPPVVGPSDLSRMPTAPDLADELAAGYPAGARAKGVPGKAIVRARILPDGRVGELALVSESGGGFGAACQQTLAGSLWSPPLDRDGQPVSTFISYTCRFNVE